MQNLKQAVIEQLGYTIEELEEGNEDLLGTLSDICNYGIDGGYGAFVYYYDTVKFFDDNEEEIMQAVTDMADSLGESKYQMIASFNCLNGDYSVDDICEAIYTRGHADETPVKNALAWFAGEEVARILDNDSYVM